MMSFPYALRSESTGLVYTGMAGDHWVEVPSLDYPPFTFTHEGAHRKASVFNNGGFAVRDFQVVRAEFLKFNSTSIEDPLDYLYQ